MITVNKATLSNGLQIVHHRDPNTAMVCVSVLYRVGSRDETDGHRGLAHLFEHLMFGGSKNIPDFDGQLQRAGGMSNAFTSDDFTYFYNLLPAQNAETAFWLESDRMNELAFTPHSLITQRNVVVEEFKQVCLNQPYGDLFHNLKRTAYTTHPYRIPVIGERTDDILATDMDTVREFFYSHYAPNNAILSVTGNIEFDKVLSLAEKWFGEIAPRDIAKADYPVEPAQTSPRSIEVSGDVPNTLIVKAYHMSGFGQEYATTDIMSDILGSGKSSRLIRHAVMENDLLLSADASISGTMDPGLLLITATLRPNTSVSDADASLTSVAKSLTTNHPTPIELNRAINQYESRLKFKNLSYDTLARSIALNAAADIDFDSLLAMYRSISVDDITACSERIIVPSNCTTLIYSPK